jgi:Alpha/beta hydrolase domain
MLREKLFIGVLLLATGSQSWCAAAPVADPVLVATPRASVLATTATNRPFLAAAKTQQPVNLAARGYAEVELLVRGLANTYEWTAAGSRQPVVIRNANQPYVTRILVRRPVDARKFSGRVIVEVLDWAAQYETAPLWGYSSEHFLRRGDAWVGVTISPVAAATLRKFNATRYGALDLAASQPEICEQPRPGGPGFAWDVIAQVGALLRSSSKENPLLGLDPQRVLAAGHALGGEAVATFAIALHRDLRLGDGAPIFDGFVEVPGLIGTTLDRCAARASPQDQPVLARVPRNAAFTSILTEMDLMLPTRQAASEAQGEFFRMYAVAGTLGADVSAVGLPTPADLAAAGVAVLAQARCREPIMDQTLSFALDAIWQQFDDLLLLKQPMTGSQPRIEAAVSGGTVGGWRLPQVDLPLAGATPGGQRANAQPVAPRVCSPVTGSMPRFDVATLKALYHDRNEYLRRFNAAVDQAVVARLLVKEDADALKAATARGLPAF